MEQRKSHQPERDVYEGSELMIKYIDMESIYVTMEQNINAIR